MFSSLAPPWREGIASFGVITSFRYAAPSWCGPLAPLPSYELVRPPNGRCKKNEVQARLRLDLVKPKNSGSDRRNRSTRARSARQLATPRRLRGGAAGQNAAKSRIDQGRKGRDRPSGAAEPGAYRSLPGAPGRPFLRHGSVDPNGSGLLGGCEFVAWGSKIPPAQRRSLQGESCQLDGSGVAFGRICPAHVYKIDKFRCTINGRGELCPLIMCMRLFL